MTKFTVIIGGIRKFVFIFSCEQDKAYLWMEGYIYGSANDWMFDDYNAQTDDCLLTVRPF